MKTTIKLGAVALLATTTILTSCESDDDNGPKETLLTGNEIPETLKTYVAVHFPENPIHRVIKDTENNIVSYDVYLEGNLELDFNSDYEIMDIDGISKLPDSVIPQAILDYVAEHYATHFITDWELENNYQQVELNHNVELEFELDGSFKRIDND